MTKKVQSNGFRQPKCPLLQDNSVKVIQIISSISRINLTEMEKDKICLYVRLDAFPKVDLIFEAEWGKGIAMF